MSSFNEQLDTNTNTNTNTNTATEIKLGGQVCLRDWKEFEKPLSAPEKTVLNALSEYVKELIDYSISDSTQSFYPSVLPEAFEDLCKKSGLGMITETVDVNQKTEKPKKNPKKKNQTGAEIREKNSRKKFKNAIDTKKKTASSINIIPPPLHNGDLLDAKILEIISYINYVMSLKFQENELTFYEIYFGIGKMLNNISKIKVKHHTNTTHRLMDVPEMIVTVLTEKYQEFTASYNFDYQIASLKYPRLFYSTNFDKILPGMDITPFPSQKKILEFVKENHEETYLCVFNTIMGMGKTWIAGFIGQLTHLLNTKSRCDGSQLKTVVYTCPEILKSVRETVGQILHSLKIPFGVAFIEDGKLRVVKQNAYKDSPYQPTFILAGVNSTIELLKNGYKSKSGWTLNPKNLVLFYDEFTMGLGPINNKLSEIVSNFPPRVILSSATLDSIDSLPELRDFFDKKYPEAVFDTVNYSKVLIGTELNNMNGKMFIPHQKCTTRDQLIKYIQDIINSSLFKKNYSIKLVYNMYLKLQELNVTIPPYLEFTNWMDQIDHRNQESIQDLGMHYLNLVLEESLSKPDIVSQFNSIEITDPLINYDDLVATSRNIDGQTFISHPDPLSELTKKFSEHFSQCMKYMNIRSFEDLNQRIQRIKEDRDKKDASSRISKSNSSEKISKHDRQMELNQTDSSDNNMPDIPIEFRLGKIKVSYSPSTIDWGSIVASDQEKFAALFGVYIYSENSHHSYHNFVIDKISKGSAKFVFADSTLNFGNSFPFSYGFILQEMSVETSKTLLQLMARAGRIGKSDSAKIYAHDDILNKVFDPLCDPEYIDYENENIKLIVQLAAQNDSDKLEAEQREAEKLERAKQCEAEKLERAKQREAEKKKKTRRIKRI